MEKLKGKFIFDLKKKYTYYSIFSNALFSNKKLYLLCNFWNKKKEFLLLDNQKKESRYDINYQGFFSLDFFSFFKIKFDYFSKWASSYLNLNDLNLKLFFDNKNKNKYLVEPLLSNDYMIFDNIFFNYNINDKKKFFYLYKGKFLLNFFFKLSKKEKLELKAVDFLYLFNYYASLNKIYYSVYFFYCWKKSLNFFFYNKIFYYIKSNIRLKIKNFIFKFFFIKKMENLLKIFFLNKKNFLNKIFNKKNIYIFRNFLNNYNNKKKI